jgi:hypothetical protein
MCFGQRLLSQDKSKSLRIRVCFWEELDRSDFVRLMNAASSLHFFSDAQWRSV